MLISKSFAENYQGRRCYLKSFVGNCEKSYCCLESLAFELRGKLLQSEELCCREISVEGGRKTGLGKN
jgi:hypothetical protein